MREDLTELIGGRYIMKEKIYKITGIIERVLALFFGGSMVILTLVQVIARYLLRNPPPWSEELARTCFIWVVYIGMSMACRKQEHVNVNFLAEKLPQTLQKWVNLISNLVVLFFLGMMTISGILLVINTRTMMMTSVDIPMGVAYTSIAVMGVIMTIYYILFIWESLLCILKKDNREAADARKGGE